MWQQMIMVCFYRLLVELSFKLLLVVIYQPEIYTRKGTHWPIQVSRNGDEKKQWMKAAFKTKWHFDLADSPKFEHNFFPVQARISHFLRMFRLNH